MNNKKTENYSCCIYYDSKYEIWKADLYYRINGKKIRKTFCGKTQEILNTRISAFKNDKLYGLISNPSLRFDNFSLEWMTTKEKYTLKPSSYDTKMRTLTKYVIPAVGHLSISKIKAKDIQKMINDLTAAGLSYSTVKKAYEVISCCHR